MARNFNGTSDFVNTSTSSTLNPALITIAFWGNTTTTAGTHWAVARDDNTLGRSYAFGIAAAGVNCQVNGTLALTGGSVPTTANAWHHMVFSGPVSTNYTVYLDGVGTVGTTAPGSMPASTGATTIGERTFSGFNDWWSGLIAEVAIWNVILTSLEVAGLANGVRAYKVRPKSLIGYWPLDGLASTEPDLSGNRFNGTLTGTTSSFGPPMTMFTPKWPVILPPPPPPPIYSVAGFAYSEW